MVKIDNTFENNSIAIGENQTDNDQIISKSKQTDIWFHLANLSSCHVILSCTKKYPATKQMIKYCAMLTKQYTKYRNRKVKVNYTTIKNIKKTKIKGQVIIKGKVKSIVV